MKGLQHTDRVEAYAQCYPTADRMFVEANSNSTEIVAQVPELKLVKPYFLSHFPFMGKNYVCSGTFNIFDADGKPYLGVLMRDTVSGDLAGYRTSGQHYLPVHESVTDNDYESISWVGKTAYLIVDGDEWGVTPTPMQSTHIAIGRFVERYHFRPNGIKWGDRFARVELDPSLSAMNDNITITENVGSGCCFGECKVTAYPRVKNARGKMVTLIANAFAINPIYDITRIEWCWTGATETITVGGQTITQPKADAWGKSQEQTIPFDAYGSTTVTVRVFLKKDGNCGCGCGDGSCCVIKELTVDVQPNAAMVCLDGSGGSTVTLDNDYQIVYSYKDNAVATAETVTGITTSAGAAVFTSPVDMNDTVALKTEIETVLDGQSVAYGAVSVTYVPAANDGENALLSVTITGVDGTIDSIEMVVNGSSISKPFVLLG